MSISTTSRSHTEFRLSDLISVVTSPLHRQPVLPTPKDVQCQSTKAKLPRNRIFPQRIHQLLCLYQAAAVEFAGGVHSCDGLAAGREFAELLLLVLTVE